MFITCWYLCFPVSQVVCHAFPFFWQVATRHYLYDSFTRALPLLSFPFFSTFMLIPSTISHLWNQPCRACRCSRQYTDAVLTLLHFFTKRNGSAGIYIYICIQMLAQNRTAVIKISCLTMFGNYLLDITAGEDDGLSQYYWL